MFKYKFLLLFMIIFIANSKQIINIEKNRPGNFVNIKKYIPDIQLDMRYFSNYNFVGRRISGYKEPVCLLTLEAINSLMKAERILLSMGLTFKVYDCYRPQQAVNDFANWAKDINNIKMKMEFYPTIDKKKLFKEHYIDYHSGHSRGSTVDLTIVPINSIIPDYNLISYQVSCTASKQYRTADNSLDFGTGFDCFSPISYPSYQNLLPQIKANRLLLRAIMVDAGFKPLETEWWHFTLLKEPYPDIYFDFPVKD